MEMISRARITAKAMFIAIYIDYIALEIPNNSKILKLQQMSLRQTLLLNVLLIILSLEWHTLL